MLLRLLRFFAIIPLVVVLVPYMRLRYRDPEELNRRADAWGQRFKDWVAG